MWARKIRALFLGVQVAATGACEKSADGGADVTESGGASTHATSESDMSDSSGPAGGRPGLNSMESQAEPCVAFQALPSNALSSNSAGIHSECADGTAAALESVLHRVDAVACLHSDEPPACGAPDGECDADDDCGTGSCVPTSTDFGACVCLPSCVSDDDCPSSEACLCRSGFASGTEGYSTAVQRTTCFPADCHVDADCGSGFTCALALEQCSFLASLHCHTAADQCETHADCTGADQGYCGWNATEARWTCFPRAVCE
jgi:hypothetical protein